MAAKFKNKLLIISLVGLSNVVFYPLAIIYAPIVILQNLGMFMCFVNLPSAYIGMKMIEKTSNLLKIKKPTLNGFVKMIAISVAFMMATFLMKVFCFPAMVLIDYNLLNLSALAVYCFVSVPIQELVIRGVLQSVYYDLLTSLRYSENSRVFTNELLKDFSKLISNICFFMFHAHKGIGFSLASFILGLYWADMSMWQDSNMVYPIFSHMIVGGFGFLLSFDVFSSQLLAAGTLPLLFGAVGVGGWLMTDNRLYSFGNAINEITKLFSETINEKIKLCPGVIGWIRSSVFKTNKHTLSCPGTEKNNSHIINKFAP
jgi:hypothetical protein